MHSNEDDSIRYLMREMDPSEEIEFERDMLNDSNLLIEVESLRSTYAKVGKLPLHQPPAHIAEQVTRDAIQAQIAHINNSQSFLNWMGKGAAAAAVVLLSFSSGYYIYQQWDSNELPNNAAINVTAAGTTQPWVDRNEILSIGDRENPMGSIKQEEDYTKSYNKLILVDDPTSLSTPNQRVTLTKSPAKQ